ncbi:hypothetical protein COB11_00160 [Candidatus Aerophobetes bacterium]|uniref:Uncharacterized protein n=1 Tax=Aerophobetes bacterium TaxID=2030807 RepID=A0A2A4YPA7_UNCAE|nr:MAG: hypothetical protein COB11_00160 [Candidatus Aerophobetes bacterium]
MSATLPAASAQCMHRISHVIMGDGTGYDVNVVYRDDLGREIILPDGYDSHCMFRDHPKMKKEIDHQLRLIAESHAEVSGKKFTDVSVIQIRDEGIYFDHSLVGNHGIAVKDDLNKAYKAEFGSQFDRVGSAWAAAKEHLVKDYQHHMKHVDDPFVEVPIGLTNHEAVPEAYLARNGTHVAPHSDTGPAVNPTLSPGIASTPPANPPVDPQAFSDAEMDNGMSVLGGLRTPDDEEDEFHTPPSTPTSTGPAQAPGFLQTFGDATGAVFNWGIGLPGKGLDWALGNTPPVPMGGTLDSSYIDTKATNFVDWLQKDYSSDVGTYAQFKVYYNQKLSESSDDHVAAQRRFLNLSEEAFSVPLVKGLVGLRVDAFVKTQDGIQGIKPVIDSFVRLKKEAMDINLGDDGTGYIAAYKNYLQLVISEQLEMALIDYFTRYYKGVTDEGKIADETNKIPKAHFQKVMEHAQLRGFCTQYSSDTAALKEAIAQAINGTALWGQFFT